ncbi:HAD family phosphatase [bacterium SCSIO 12741]|nr:HAD family phosphatase [bacterium SCSIO 12741]
MPARSEIKNIIFDLGGVIINIDPGLTLEQFQKVYPGNFLDRFRQPDVQEILHGFETGKYDEANFIKELQKAFDFELEKEEFIRIWNLTLLDTPPERISLIQQLSNEFRVFLLSNTNPTHMEAYFAQMAEDQELWFPDLFEKAYLSYNMGLRKPDPEIFKTVLKEQVLLPEETLFLDDTLEHIESAKSVGIHTWQVTDKPITSLLNDTWR